MKKYILLIEDEKFQSEFFSHIIENEFKKKKYIVKTVNSGNEALKILISDKKNDIGLILLDLSLFDISGFDLLKKLSDQNIKIPVAVLSAHEEPDIIEEAKKLGAKEYFIKGKDVDELYRLNKFIDKMMQKYFH
jgi:CheY-like chemotaxis protein